MQENSTFKETTLNDYIPTIKKYWPDIPVRDIKTILNYGWRLLYLACIAGCDVNIYSHKYQFWFYLGNLTKSSIRHFNYYREKLICRIKFNYDRTKPEWDGYYYTMLSKAEYEKYFKSRGRKRKNITITNRSIYKYKECCILHYFSCRYIIKFPYVIDVGFKKYYTKLNIKGIEEVTIKSASNFQDILVNNNDYVFL